MDRITWCSNIRITDTKYREQNISPTTFLAGKVPEMRHHVVLVGISRGNAGWSSFRDLIQDPPNMVRVSRLKAIIRSAYLASSYSGHVRLEAATKSAS